MAGTGLTDALQTCYGPVTIGHMMSGKAVSRSVCGHFLVSAALHVLLLFKIDNDDIMEQVKSVFYGMMDLTFVPSDDNSAWMHRNFV